MTQVGLASSDIVMSCEYEARIILCKSPANERCCYSVTASLIGGTHTQNDPWLSHNLAHYPCMSTLLQTNIYKLISSTNINFWPPGIHFCCSPYEMVITVTFSLLYKTYSQVQGIQRSGKSQGNSRLGKSQGKVREFCWRSGKKWILEKVREFAFSAI